MDKFEREFLEEVMDLVKEIRAECILAKPNIKDMHEKAEDIIYLLRLIIR